MKPASLNPASLHPASLNLARLNLARPNLPSLAGMLLALIALAAPAHAETYPSHPVTMLVGYPPGGPTDTLARILAKGMESSLHQTVVVETVSGAAGTIATGRVARAKPDGYTIGIGNWTSHVGAAAIYPLDYDIIKDLQPISLLAASPLWILGKNALPPNNAAELIAWLKAQSQPVTFGTVGAGSAAHLVGLSFGHKIGAHFQFVPYRGAGPAITDLIGGQIDLTCLEASATLPSVQAGKFKAYAVMSEKRWPKSPNTPTMIEAGVPGFSLSFWHGLWTTQGTPKAIVDRLDEAVKVALGDPVMHQRLETLGMVVFPPDQQNPAALAAYHKAEIDTWWPIIKAAGIKAGN